MKTIRIALIGTLLFAFSSAWAGNGSGLFSEFYNKYNSERYFVSFSLPSEFFQLFVKNSDASTKELAREIDQIRFLSYDGSADSSKMFSRELSKKLSSKNYNDLMSIKDGGESIQFKIREKQDRIKELLMIIHDETSLVVLCVEGDIDPKNAEKLSESIDARKGTK